MTFYDRLLHETQAERAAFLSTPLIQRATTQGVSLPLYLSFLTEAYHHVKETPRLLALSLAQCDPRDRRMTRALLDYLNEEYGHELWILDDIKALGGDAAAVESGKAGEACRVMVGYVTWAITARSPYAFLGMGHVLEGMSVALAEQAAGAIATALAPYLAGKNLKSGAGFSYLRSHGVIDTKHVEDFKTLVNALEDRAAQAQIIETAKTVYHLYGKIFDELDRRFAGAADAA